MNLIFGCGYLGERVAALWEAGGERVAAVTRSAERAAQWNAAGRQAILADITRPETLEQLPAVDTVLWAVGFDRAAGPDMREVYVEGLSNVLAALSKTPPRRLVYISSTSVHGPADGDRINEQSTCTPDRENGRICLEAEELLRRSALGSRAVILRLAGIYGPGRLPNLVKLSAGEPIAAQPDHHLNLIHVGDAASAAVAASQESISSPNLYLVADGQPATRRQFYEHAAQLWQTPVPVFAENIAATSRRGSTHDKRIDSSKLRRELLPQLRYADFRSGLAAIRAAEQREN